MSNYAPDCWVIVRINHKRDPFCKVLAGWSGGYLDKDSWRLSSGLANIVEDGEFYLMHNKSGSVYKCHKHSEGMNSLSGSIFAKMEEVGDVKIITVEEFNKEFGSD